jgi:flagellar basal body-associated protein FliL
MKIFREMRNALIRVLLALVLVLLLIVICGFFIALFGGLPLNGLMDPQSHWLIFLLV